MTTIRVHVEATYVRTLDDLERICAAARQQSFTGEATVELETNRTLIRVTEEQPGVVQ